MLVQRLNFYRSLLLLTDALLIAASWLAAYYLRFNLQFIEVTKGVPPLSIYAYGLIQVMVIWLGTFHFAGLYRVSSFSWRQVFAQLIRAGFIAFLVLVAFTYFTHRQSFSRVVFVYFFIISTGGMLLARLWLKKLFIASGGRGVKLRTLIVGVGQLAETTADKLCNRPELGLEVVGFLANDPQSSPPRVCDSDVLGSYDDLIRVVNEKKVGLVFLALPLEYQTRLPDILDSISDEMVEVKVIPDFGRFSSLKSSVEELDGLPMISLRESPMHGWNRVVKRATDIIMALLTIIAASPLMGLAVAAVKLTSKGPIFYTQERMGLDGRIFTMAKFRTMRTDAEKTSGPVWAAKDDPRRTAVGRFLRRFSIDELPQLFQVLMGEMSLVGPRPERPEFIEKFKHNVPKYMLRHKMKAGMTGLAQVEGFRGNTSLEGRIQEDLKYIKDWSLGLDLKILARTLWAILFDRNAY